MGLAVCLEQLGLQVVCVQETQSPLMSSLPVDQPFRYDGLVSCSTLPLWRPLSLGPPTHSPFAGVSSRGLSVSAPFMRHMLAFPLTLASSSGARSQPQSIASRSSTQAPRFFLRETPTFGSPVDAPLLPIVQEILQSHSLVFRNRPDLPTHRCGAALDIILSSPSLPGSVTVHSGSNCCSLAPLCCPLLSSDHMLCSCHLDIPQASLLPDSTHSSLPRVRDWSAAVAVCHHSLTEWHQSILAHISGPLPGFPARASLLDSLFDSLTRILFDCASLQSRRRLGSRPRTRQPLWWNDACYHALVARNGSWCDFRRSGSHEDQVRFRLLRQQFHSTVRSSRTHFWNEWLGSVTSLSHRAPRLACSLVRHTFRSSVASPNLCHMQWDGASRSALPPDEARSQWHAHFSSPTGDTRFSDDFLHSLTLRFASLTSLHDTGRFDVPFSYNELVAALSKCNESVPGADGLPYSLFKV